AAAARVPAGPARAPAGARDPHPRLGLLLLLRPEPEPAPALRPPLARPSAALLPLRLRLPHLRVPPPEDRVRGRRARVVRRNGPDRHALGRAHARRRAPAADR